MFKLTIIHGPSKGSVFKFEDGERTVGRAPGNDIVIVSQQISKKHCSFTIFGDEVTLRDTGSSNGTFVNGIMTKQKKLVSGDRVSIGDAIIELTKLAETNNVIPIRGMPIGGQATGGFTGGITGLGGVGAPGDTTHAAGGAATIELEPKDLKAKVKFYFEKFVLNFLYNLNEKQEWRTIVGGIFVVISVGAAVLSVYPVLERTTEKLENEARERGLLVARQIMERNSNFLY